MNQTLIKCLSALVLVAFIIVAQAEETFAFTKASSNKNPTHRNEGELFDDESNNIEDYDKQDVHDNEKFLKTKTSVHSDKQHRDESFRWFKKLQEQLLDQSMRQGNLDKDHLMMERWLVDNINALHSELKQTETDLEHYVQVTKNILVQNEAQLRNQLASALSQPVPSKTGRYRAVIEQQEGPNNVEQSKWQVDSLQTLILSEIAKQKSL